MKIRGRPIGRWAGVASVVLTCLLALPPGAEASTRTFTFRGRGWGHGLGMSQWGARGLAERGHSAGSILTRYYTGTAVTRMTTPTEIRVGVLQEQRDVKVSGDGRFDLFDNTGTKMASGIGGDVWRIAPLGTDRLAVYGPLGTTSFTSGLPVTIRYEGYRTEMQILKTGRHYDKGRLAFGINPSTGQMRVVLTIGFEKYLYGIAEMPSSWHIEALKAQAIAARTYAMERVGRLGQHRTICDCAVYSTTADQVYAGAPQEVPRWMEAVDETAGRVVTYGGKPIQAMYSSSSGGYTENNESLSSGKALPYLRGVCDPGDYVGGTNPHSNWSVAIDGTELDERLQSLGVGTVSKIEVVAPRGVSGRVRPVLDTSHGGFRITGSDRVARVSANTFRSLVGLPSTLIFYRVSGAIRTRYDRLGCAPGLPTGEAKTWRDLSGLYRGHAQNFVNGRLFENADTSTVFWTKGAILANYDALRAKDVDFGLPTSDEYGVTGGRRSDFEHGYIVLDTSTGQTTAYRR